MKRDGEDVEAVVEGGDPVYLTITVDRGEGCHREDVGVQELTVTVEPRQPWDGDATTGCQGRRSCWTLSDEPMGSRRRPQSTTAEIVLTAVIADEDVGDEALLLITRADGPR